MDKKSNLTINKSLNIAEKTTIENKLTHASLIASYAFQQGVNFEARTITISGDLEGWFDTVDAALTIMENKSRESITIRICSPGGSTYEATAIIGRLKGSKAHIVTEGYGHVMSAATLILAAGKRRRMSRFARMMWHEASFDPGDNRTSAHRDVLKEVEREERLWAKWMAEFSDKDENFWYRKGVRKDAYFDAEELLELGVVDEVF